MQILEGPRQFLATKCPSKQPFLLYLYAVAIQIIMGKEHLW